MDVWWFFLECFINPVTSNNRKEKNPKGLGDPTSLLMSVAISPCLSHLCCAKGWPLSPLFPPRSRAATAENLEAAGAPVQRLLINASFPPTSARHSHSNIASLLSRQETQAEGNTENPCGSVCWNPVCVKFANNSLRKDSRVFSLLWGLVWRFSWENRPLSPPPV